MAEEFSLFRRKDTGRWVATIPTRGDWRNTKQYRVPPTVKSERDARAWANDKLRALRDAGWEDLAPARFGPTLGSLVDKIMALRKQHPDVAPATLSNNRTHIKMHIVPKLGMKPMGQIDVPVARKFLRELRDANSPHHTRNIFSTARMLFDVARGEGWTKAPNPFREASVIEELPKARTLSDPVGVPLPIAQRLIWSTDIPDDRRVRYMVAFTSGARDGEIAGFRWRDLGLADVVPVARVVEALALRGPEGHATMKAPKTDTSKRPIPLHPETVVALTWWRDVGWPRLVRMKPRPQDFVFPRADGTPVRPRSADLIRKDIRGVLEAAPGDVSVDVEQIDFHATRGTFSSALKARGIPEDDRGKLLGHSGKTVESRHYTQHEFEHLAKAVAVIPLIWAPVQSTVRTPLQGAQHAPDYETTSGAPETNRTSDQRFRKWPDDVQASPQDSGTEAKPSDEPPSRNGYDCISGRAPGGAQDARTSGCVACLPFCPCAPEPARFAIRGGHLLPLNAPARARQWVAA